jgi:flavin-binding protein dodecin
LTFLNLSTLSQTGGNPGTNNYPPFLYQGYVSPGSGTPSTLFTYQVIYQDYNNDTPVIKNVYIDGVPHSMTYVSGNVTMGAIYQYSTYLPVGNHNYYFYFTDGWTNGSARDPSNGTYKGPMVSYTSGGGLYPPMLYQGNVTPSTGSPSTVFTYQVTFKDYDNVAPVDRNVTIDGTSYTMSYVSGAFNQGALYQYQTTLAVGNHTYYFNFTDNNNSARLPANGTYYGPSVSYSGGTQNTPPTLSNGFVNPQSGTPNTIFTYQVTYLDIDNDPPVIHNVVIDNTSFQMNFTSGTYYQGAIYQYKTPLFLGNHTYYFYFTDGKNGTGRLPAQGNYSGPYVTNSAPTNSPPKLYYGYVSPTSGTTSTVFTYQITYSDSDNDTPTLKYVYIDGLPYVMTLANGSINTGAQYKYQTKLTVGTHNFYFQFSDGKSTSRLPTQGSITGPSVTSGGPLPNNPPSLMNGTVAPQAGNITTSFTYTVYYKDIDNDAPTMYNVYINGMAYQMSKISGSYTSGVLYQYTTTLPAGNHSYYFYFSDGKATAKLPVYGSYYGPAVSAPNGTNNAPTLFYGFVSPQSGTTSTSFTYQVYYKDIDNDQPVIKSVFIDNKGFSMTKITGNYNTGALYQYTTTLAVGSHNYYFYFSDGIATARLPASGTYQGPTVTQPPANNAPYLFYGYVTPSSGTTMTTFTYKVYYKDLDNDAPTIKDVYIDGTANAMTLVTGSYNTGALFEFKTTLGVGTHNYYFHFSDGKASRPNSYRWAAAYSLFRRVGIV